MAGIRYFLRFAREVGAVAKVDANKIYKGAWKVLLESAAAQARGRSADEPARRFLDLIAAAHLRGDAYFGSCSSDQDTASGEKRGRLIGWTADGMILLDPDSAFTTVHQLAEQQGESLAVGKKTLGRRFRTGFYRDARSRAQHEAMDGSRNPAPGLMREDGHHLPAGGRILNRRLLNRFQNRLRPLERTIGSRETAYLLGKMAD